MVNAAVYVVADVGVVTECDAAPASDQLVNRYCTPMEPACDAAAIVWMEPWIHWNVHGDVQATLSTVSNKPGGELSNATFVRLAYAVTVGTSAHLCSEWLPRSDTGWSAQEPNFRPENRRNQRLRLLRENSCQAGRITANNGVPLEYRAGKERGQHGRAFGDPRSNHTVAALRQHVVLKDKTRARRAGANQESLCGHGGIVLDREEFCMPLRT